MVAHGVLDDLHQQGTRIGDFIQSPERFQCMQRHFLFEIFVVNGRASPARRDVNQCPNLRRAKNHVTVFPAARLYLA